MDRSRQSGQSGMGNTKGSKTCGIGEQKCVLKDE